MRILSSDSRLVTPATRSRRSPPVAAPSSPTLRFWRRAALRHASRYLKERKGDADALLLCARLHVDLGDARPAVSDFDAALARSVAPAPETYLARARAQLAIGNGRETAALRGVEEGIARLGGAVPLQLRAVELERALGRFDDALLRLRGLAALSERQESWLAREGDLLLAAGRTGEARRALVPGGGLFSNPVNVTL